MDVVSCLIHYFEPLADGVAVVVRHGHDVFPYLCIDAFLVVSGGAAQIVFVQMPIKNGVFVLMGYLEYYFTLFAVQVYRNEQFTVFLWVDELHWGGFVASPTALFVWRLRFVFCIVLFVVPFHGWGKRKPFFVPHLGYGHTGGCHPVFPVRG